MQRAMSIFGLGLRASTGLSALQATMGLRTEQGPVVPTRFVDKSGEPFGLALVGALPDSLYGATRLLELLLPAVEEALALTDLAGRELGIFVAAPDELLTPQEEPMLWQTLQAELPTLAGATTRKVVRAGRAGGGAALGQAGAFLAQNPNNVALVAAVDSYYDGIRLEGLDEAWRVHTAETENGFLPGEAAAACVLSHGPLAQKAGGKGALGQVVAVGLANEPRPLGSELPNQALGLTQACQTALGGAGAAISDIFTDVVNERHRVEEFLLAQGRLAKRLTADARHWQLNLIAGDCGAASLLLSLAFVCTCWQTGAMGSPLVLLTAASDGPSRAAVLLRKGER